METSLVKNLDQIATSQQDIRLKMNDIWVSIQKLHIEFELNPKAIGTDIIPILEKTIDEFAILLKEIATKMDDASKRIGELSLNIMKLCIRLQNKIYYFYNRSVKSFSVN